MNQFHTDSARMSSGFGSCKTEKKILLARHNIMRIDSVIKGTLNSKLT